MGGEGHVQAGQRRTSQTPRRPRAAALPPRVGLAVAVGENGGRGKGSRQRVHKGKARPWSHIELVPLVSVSESESPWHELAMGVGGGGAGCERTRGDVGHFQAGQRRTLAQVSDRSTRCFHRLRRRAPGGQGRGQGRV